MIVVSDTTALTNLFQIGEMHILKEVFGEIVIPEAVYRELGEIPDQLESIDSQDWINVQKVIGTDVVEMLKMHLDEGESEAIALALEIGSDFLVIDEWKGRRKAAEMGLQVIGLIGILSLAKRKGIISAVRPILDKMIEMTGFRILPALYRNALQNIGE
ncbi:MAG: DUF3368 domain-containing protein [Saprospiraceae bacterium]|nr:DUF3368 domain-containing protein [Saprospiraceae bacterium]